MFPCVCQAPLSPDPLVLHHQRLAPSGFPLQLPIEGPGRVGVTSNKISRRPSSFCSITYKMLFPQLLCFEKRSVLSGGVPPPSLVPVTGLLGPYRGHKSPVTVRRPRNTDLLFRFT